MKRILKNHSKSWFYILTGVCVSSLLMISACVSTTPSELHAGVFTAGGRVAGLEYKSSHKQGITDSRGVFYFNEGDTVEFFLGGTRIGYPIVNITAEKRTYSPSDLVNEADSPELKKNTVVNISRLLQSLDLDGKYENPILIESAGNYENLINITSPIKAQMVGMSIAFNVDGADFQTDPGIVALFARLNSAGIYASTRLLVSYDTAKTNLIVGMIIDKDVKPPAVLINLGDDWACGTRSGFGNLDEYKQIYGYASQLAGKFGGIFDIPWDNPWLDSDNGTIQREDATQVPYNLSVPGATAKSVLEETTFTAPPDDNSFLNELLKPLDMSIYGTELNITQLDALDKLMTENDTSLVNIITLTVGNNDIFRALLETDDGGKTYTADLTDADISSFLGSHGTADVEDKLTDIVDRLTTKYPDAYIFISNLPDIDRIGVLFDKSDINNHKTPGPSNPFGCVLTNMPDSGYIGLPAFKSLGEGAANLLGKSSTCAELNTAIGDLLDSDTLTDTEAGLIQARINAINQHIEDTLPNAYDKVVPVDINQMFHDIEDKDSESYIRGDYKVTFIDDRGVEKTISLNTGYGGGVFSLDGLTLSISGSSLVANEFNKKIRDTLENNLLGSNTILDLLGEDVQLDVPLESAYQIDPYRDEDRDGYIRGGSSLGTIHEYFNYLIDCDDSDFVMIAPFHSEGSCQ